MPGDRRVGMRSSLSRVRASRGRASKKSLNLVDVLPTEVGHLTGRFDTFGQCGETEVPAKLDEGADESLGLG